jgi:glucokinase
MGTDKRVAVGIEVTGSGANVALVDGLGRIHYRCQARTLWGRPATATLEPYIRAIEAALAYAQVACFQVCGLGVCVPGSIDATAGRPLQLPTLPALNNFPLCDFLTARYKLPVKLFVDVDAALLGEQRYGAGAYHYQGFQRVLLLRANAVVGAALIVGGKLEQATQAAIGHICHMPASTSGPRCSCGKRGCINMLASLDAMRKMVQRALLRGEETSLAQRLLDGENFTPQLLAEEAARGDSVAGHVYSEVGRWLGAATVRYIDLFEPQALILAGDIFVASDRLFTQVRHALITHASSRVATMVEVALAQLGGDAALIGCATAFFVPRG